MSDLDDRKALIQRLFGAANKSCDEAKMDGYLEALKLMDTPRLMRVCERVLDGIRELTDPEDYRPPTAGALWKVYRRLRALPTAPPLTLHGAPEQKPDGWAVNANLLLLAYVTRGLLPKMVGIRGVTMPDAGRYAPDSRYDSAKRCVVPGPLTIARTAVLVKWKNVWARDMREDRELYDGKLEGRAFWLDCMARAEAELDEMIGLERAAA